MSLFATIRSALSDNLVKAAEKELLHQIKEHVELIARPIASLLESKGIEIQEADVQNVLLAAVEHFENALK